MSVTETQSPHANITTNPNAVLAGDTAIYLGLALFVAMVGVITAIFGLPGLAMSALAMVPVIFTALILITVGK